MGATIGKKKANNIDGERRHQRKKNGGSSKHTDPANLQQSDSIHRDPPPMSNHIPSPDYMEGGDDDDLIKPRKLLNPVKASTCHQELHRELMSSCRRSCGGSAKAELQRVLETRKRDQLIKQRKQEDDAHRKVSPLEAELTKRHQRLDELERQQQNETEENLKAPEFIKVKEKLRQTCVKDEKEA